MSLVDRLRAFFTGKPDKDVTRAQMVTEWGESYYAWDGKIYESDIIRACIRPKVQAVGKATIKHLYETTDRDGRTNLVVNPRADVRKLLEMPNPWMTGQMLLEKMVTQLMLNGNAWALVNRTPGGTPKEIYPVTASAVEVLYTEQGDAYIKFTLLNGKTMIFSYGDLIHLRRDYNEKDIIGSSQMTALKGVMNVVGTIDQSIIRAVKNSGVIRWLLTAKQSVRPEDLKKNVKEFVDNYLSYESEAFGAAGTDAKFEAKQITPTDYVPNFKLSEQQIARIYAFFNTNQKIVTSSYTEEEWNSYYEAEIEPVILQLSQTWTQRLFSARERACGNRIEFEASNLQYASMKTRLEFVQFFDRGIMNANEIRTLLNLPPIDGGDKFYVRLDTAPVEEGEEPQEGAEEEEGIEELGKEVMGNVKD